jgi:PAS domain S-box-containing protein
MNQDPHSGKDHSPPKPPGTLALAWRGFKLLRHPKRSVRGRLIGVVLLNTIIVVIVSSAAILMHDLAVYRSSWAADLATEASIIALSTAPALAFDDRKVAGQDLAALQARPRVQAAAIYLPAGSLYASYLKPGASQLPITRPPLAEGVEMLGDEVQIARRISYNGEFLGTIYLRAHYDVIQRIQAYLGILAFITILSLVLALILSASLQQAITVPLEVIAEVARQIVNRQDYSLRVVRTTDDEIGIVVQALNNMLGEVQLRTRALEQSNATLLEEAAVRQAAEAALARANARLESTMAAAEIGGWVLDLKSRRLTADRNFAALYGVSDEAALNGSPALTRRRIHADDLAAVDAANTEALKTGVFPSTEFRIMRPDGTLRWVIGRGKVLFDAEGAPSLMAGLLIDLTAQKLAEQQRRDSDQIYRAIGDSIDYGVWLTDAQGRIIYTSESLLRLIGMTPEQYSESGWAPLLHPDDVEGTMEGWRECIRTGQAWYREHRVRATDGNYHPVLSQGIPVRRENGATYAWAGINLDISRIKRTEEALREADQRKDEFLATLAHELRNPLAPIRNATYLLSLPVTSEQQRQWAHEVIARQVQHMALLLDDLLDVSRISRGRLDLKKEYVYLSQLLDSAVEMARPLIDAKRHNLDLRLPEESVEVNIDPLRISQALCNLLTNAAKYTDAGGNIALVAAVEAEGLSISVIDNGIGLSEASLSYVFEMFSQVESALGRSQGGLGIGLALARGLVALHGGTLEAMSQGVGCGSTFVMRLPRSALGPRPVQAISNDSNIGAVSVSSGPILLADDNCDAADSLSLLLGLQGYDVQIAYNGREALELASTTHPAVLILDIGMPELNGYEVALRIRQQSWGREVMLIALTGWGQQGDMERAYSAGFDRHFSKPVNFDDLLSCLAEFRARRETVR